MPNTLGAKKRLRQSVVRRARNRSMKTAVKNQLKKVVAAAEAGDVEKAEAEFRVAARRLDRAGAKNVIHKNAASRQKSRLQKLIKKAKAPAS